MLVGFSAIEQNELLNIAVPEIVRASNNPDSNAITMAIGSAVSSGANPDQARSAVLAAAKANVFTPEATPDYATAAIALARSTGRDDARENMALLVSTGAQAQITDPAKLALNLAPAVGNSVATVPGQDKVEASREAAAIFGTLSKAATDVQGDSSRTATIQLTAQLGKFFGDLESQRVDARSRVEALDKKIASGGGSMEKERIERDRLSAFLTQAGGMSDPGTLFGRLGALQQNDAIRGQFFSTEFGEAQYKTAFKQLADSTSALAAEVTNAKAQITVDASQFESLLIAQSRTTPQQKLAYSQAGIAAITESRDVSNTEGSSLNFVRETTATALRDNRGRGAMNAARSLLGDGFVSRGALPGGTAAEEAVAAIGRLIERRSEIVSDGIDEGESEMVAQLNATIDNLRAFIVDNGRSLSQTSLLDAADRADVRSTDTLQRSTIGPSGEVERFDQQQFFADLARDFRRVAEATEQQNKLLAEQKAIAEQQAHAAQQTATNTTPPARQPNFAAGQQAAAAYGSAP